MRLRDKLASLRPTPSTAIRICCVNGAAASLWGSTTARMNGEVHFAVFETGMALLLTLIFAIECVDPMFDDESKYPTGLKWLIGLTVACVLVSVTSHIVQRLGR